jgi:hypothetical protein
LHWGIAILCSCIVADMCPLQLSFGGSKPSPVSSTPSDEATKEVKTFGGSGRSLGRSTK